MSDKLEASGVQPLAPLQAGCKRRCPLPGRVIVNANGTLFFVEDDQSKENPECRVPRFVFTTTYLSRQAWLRPSRFDVKASQVAPGCRFSAEDVLAALRKIPASHWKTTGRANVRPAGVEAIDSITLGLVSCMSTQGILLPSLKTRLYPSLCRMLLQFWKQELMEDPTFKESGCQDLVCTSIQLNRNYAAREHVDGNNLGPSWLIAVGDWTSGGELFVEDPTGGEVHTLTSDVWGRNSWRLRTGELCRGQSLQAHNRWVRFDGRKMHFVREFAGGDRFSLVFFVAARHATAPSAARSVLSVLGFPLPFIGSVEAEHTEKSLPLGSVLKLDSEKRVIDMTPTAKPSRAESEVWIGSQSVSSDRAIGKKKRRRLRMKQPSPERTELATRARGEAAAQAAAEEWARAEVAMRAAALEAAVAAEAAFRAANSAEAEKKLSENQDPGLV